jgi:hypothetical protein
MLSKDELKQRIDIVDLIGRTVKLSKSGITFKGLCPFHADNKTLSLVVYPKDQTWHCFGCSKRGDAYSWVMEIEKIDFKAALTQLQEQYGDSNNVSKTPKQTVWDITDADGKLVAQHIRYDLPGGGKKYSWRRDGKDNLGGLKVEDLPLYGLKHLFESPSLRNAIIITEGEKAADALSERGYAALRVMPVTYYLVLGCVAVSQSTTW